MIKYKGIKVETSTVFNPAMVQIVSDDFLYSLPNVKGTDGIHYEGCQITEELKDKETQVKELCYEISIKVAELFNLVNGL